MRRKNTLKKQPYCMNVENRIPVESDIENHHVVISIRHLCWEQNKDCLQEMQNSIMFRTGWDTYLLSQCILSFRKVEVP